MSNDPYEFVQIIDDDDWQLIGIIPKNNKTLSHDTPQLDNNHPISHNTESSHLDPKPINAIIINKRRPTNKIITPIDFSDSTPIKSEFTEHSNSIPIDVQTSNNNPNFLEKSNYDSLTGLNTDIFQSTPKDITTNQYTDDINISSNNSPLFGELSNLIGLGRDNLLVGFGR